MISSQGDVSTYYFRSLNFNKIGCHFYAIPKNWFWKEENLIQDTLNSDFWINLNDVRKVFLKIYLIVFDKRNYALITTSKNWFFLNGVNLFYIPI